MSRPVKPPTFPLPAGPATSGEQAPPIWTRAAPAVPPQTLSPPSDGGVFREVWHRVAEELQQRRVHHSLTGFLASFILHTAVLILLGLFLLQMKEEGRAISIVIGPQVPHDEPELADASPSLLSLDPVHVAEQVAETNQFLTAPEAPNIAAPWEGKPQPDLQPVVVEKNWSVTPSVLLERNASPVGGGIQGRRAEARARLVQMRGGTPESEQAVALALAWLAAHQRPDGSWRFDHQAGRCEGRCPDPGTAGTSTGATALALLPFLGANESPQEGEYREVVKRGLYYLTGKMIDTRHGGDFQEGTMYAQGISAICLSEAYAMTGDTELRFYAQKAVDFICNAQHPRGGWRYYPGQPGDTTSFGWQLMALKSARLAGLDVPSPIIERAKGFLDTVTADGVFYGYLSPGRTPSTTAVGLLCRMYTGWPQGDERLARGVEYLAARGPSPEDMYFNYYATQCLHHFEGPQWPRWNARLREHLVRTQAREGHLNGSWFFPDRHGAVGGRLYTTAICAMILEVYYRHMPLYSSASVEDEF